MCGAHVCTHAKQAMKTVARLGAPRGSCFPPRKEGRKKGRREGRKKQTNRSPAVAWIWFGGEGSSICCTANKGFSLVADYASPGSAFLPAIFANRVFFSFFLFLFAFV